MKQFFLFFGVQFCLYALLTLNMRSVQNVWPMVMVGTDVCILTLNFEVIDRINKTTPHDKGPARLGYMMGGAVGSLFSLYASIWGFGR